jgi:DNA-binding SARP family transcriptional activator
VVVEPGGKPFLPDPSDSREAIVSGAVPCADRLRAAATLRLLGGFDLQRHGRAVLLRSRKSRAVLAYLVSRRGHAVARDTLTALLWPEAAPTDARHSLRQALSLLRDALGPDVIESCPGRDLLLRTGGHLAVDVEQFETAAASATSTHRHEAEACAATAVRLYRGDLLSGVALSDAEPFEEWLAIERSRLRDLAAATLERAETLCVRRGDERAAAQLAERRLRLDDLSEATARRLATLLARSGLRSRALAELGRLRERLRDELGAVPEPATAHLAERLRNGGTIARDGLPETSSFAAHRVPILPLLEREDALAALAHDWSAVRQGASRFSHLVGQGGSGKSRLARTAVDDVVAATEARVVPTCGCAASLPLPGGPFARLLAAHDPDPVLEELAPGCHPARGDAERRSEASDPNASAPPTVLLLDDLDALHPGRESALVALAAKLAAQGPVWWLSTSLASCRSRTRRLSARIASALGASCREIEVAPLSSAALATIAWSTLEDEDALRLVRILEGAGATLPLEIAEQLTLLVDLGELSLGPEGVWRLDPRAEARAPVRGLRPLIEQRLDQLPPTARRLLALAAVAGPCFPTRGLALAEGEDEEIVARALETLVERWFLRPWHAGWHGLGTSPEDEVGHSTALPLGFEFAQRTTRRLTLASIDRVRRQELERRLRPYLDAGAPIAELDAIPPR